MHKPKLYLLLGYPGSGKTTASKILSELTGAIHIWADFERKKNFGRPSYSKTENDELYNQLNNQALALLLDGKDVIYDTSFNYYADRQKLRQIASKANANVRIIWVVANKNIAKIRATKDSHLQHTRAVGDMNDDDFTRLSSQLEPPKPSEPYTKLDGTKITPQYLKSHLKI